jgi:hypothetical protein
MKTVKIKTIKHAGKNCLGTADFLLTFEGWRKAQKFCAYPMQKGEGCKILRLQSEKRWIEIDLLTGAGIMTNGKGGHPNSWLLSFQKSLQVAETFTISPADLQMIKEVIFLTAGSSVGSSIVTCDNSEAFNVLGQIL